MWESCSLGKYFWTPQKKLSAIFSHRDHDNHCAFERLSLSLSLSRKSKTQTGLCVRRVCATESGDMELKRLQCFYIPATHFA